MRFTSEQIDVDDYHAAVELFFERGWTDGWLLFRRPKNWLRP